MERSAENISRFDEAAKRMKDIVAAAKLPAPTTSFSTSHRWLCNRSRKSVEASLPVDKRTARRPLPRAMYKAAQPYRSRRPNSKSSTTPEKKKRSMNWAQGTQSAGARQ